MVAISASLLHEERLNRALICHMHEAAEHHHCTVFVQFAKRILRALCRLRRHGEGLLERSFQHVRGRHARKLLARGAARVVARGGGRARKRGRRGLQQLAAPGRDGRRVDKRA